MTRGRALAVPSSGLSVDEEQQLAGLRDPPAIQAFLDGIPYSTDPIYRAPRRVLRDRRAHCLDGAVLAAAALSRIGDPPLLVDMRAVRDDDHVIAVFARGRGRGRRLGAIAKSNMVGLRYRDPVYRDLRELVMSYFDDYYNTDGDKTLRWYSRPVDLDRDRPLAALLRRAAAGDPARRAWRTSDEALDQVVARLDAARHHRLLDAAQEAALQPVDERAYRAGLLGADADGLYAADRLKIPLG